jgi:hypothetical protein
MMDAATATPPAATAHAKQYVFVDEYNRHKRLKVMRACDGCRKRKIRCDGALQNGPWPCGACVRLKLKCVPPTLDPDDEQQGYTTTNGNGQFTFQTNIINTNTPPKTPIGLPSPHGSVQSLISSANALPVISPPTSAPQIPDTSSQYYMQISSRSYEDEGYFGGVTNGTAATATAAQFRPAPSLLRTATEASGSSGGDPQEVDATVKELSEQMGDLSIEISSAAPYILGEKKALAETPAVEDPEIVLPPSVGTDPTIRIPPEMMLSDERAMDYFGYYFNHIHPYLPVLNRAAFYEQWRSARHTISPLLLEGIFACVSRYLEDLIEHRRWLALAARHEEGFKDVPRLSTIQAMLLLAKARESVPRRGYYYRSWMAVKYLTTMAFDLGLHEHYDQHHFGSGCRHSKADCMIRTRVWQSLFATELLVGAPQGRTDFAVDHETIETDLPVFSNEIDPYEHQISRKYTYLARLFKIIKVTNIMWQTGRRTKKAWALEADFVQHNDEVSAWVKQLPSDLQLHYPEDGSPPWLANDHFVAHMHSYYLLVILMHHRPQLQQLLERRDPSFKAELEICLHAATQMCRVQEAILRDFGLHGLHFMIRGIGFTIYCVLTCTMLHLVCCLTRDQECLLTIIRPPSRRQIQRLVPRLTYTFHDICGCSSTAFHQLPPKCRPRSTPCEKRSAQIPRSLSS